MGEHIADRLSSGKNSSQSDDQITADGIVPFEIPVMTQVLLEEACLLPENRIEFILHSGDHIICG